MKVSFLDVFRFAAGYWLRQPWKFACILALVVCAAFLETNLPNALSLFLGAIRAGGPTHAIYFYFGLFLAIYFAYTILFNLYSLIYNHFETRVFKTLVDEVYAHVQSLSERFFINTFSGSIITKINRARYRIETFEDQVVHKIVPTAMVLISSCVLLSFHFPALAALVAAYLVLLVGVSVALVLSVAGPAQAAAAQTDDLMGGALADGIAGMATTKAYAQEPRELSLFRVVTETMRRRTFRAYALSNTTALVQQLMLGGMLALLLGGGVWYFLHGLATVEDMAYLALAYAIIQSYVREIGENIKNMLTASYDLHAVVALAREVPDIQDASGTPLEVTRGAIEFRDIDFIYPGKETPLFKNFSVSIRPGERVALVGHSGSGKTTFVRLVQRLYNTSGGAIAIDGQNIAEVSQASLRGAIALVPQDPILFHRSLQDNIAYGKADATLNEVRIAAQKAHIDEFIQGLPQGYGTLVGERGVKLSGGERQRVAIARAILADRPILILDEATSSLDSASERAIQEGLRELTHGRTSIMIAHRLSTIRDADRILVFDKGAIVEEGSHDELVVKESGVYAGLYKLQSGGFIGE